jgi:hypothetical protein
MDKTQVIVKPYNYKGHLELSIVHLRLEDFYIKQQLYDLIFEDVDVFIEHHKDKHKHEEKRTHYKLKAERSRTKLCEIRLQADLVVPVMIDYSLLF